MAFSSTSQSATLRMGNQFVQFFTGSAGAASNTIDVDFIVEYLVGLTAASASFSQSGKTVTVSGLTNGSEYTFLLAGSRSL